MQWVIHKTIRFAVLCKVHSLLQFHDVVGTECHSHSQWQSIVIVFGHNALPLRLSSPCRWLENPASSNRKYLTNMDQSRSRWWCQHHAVNTAILSATTNNTRCYKFDFRLNPNWQCLFSMVMASENLIDMVQIAMSMPFEPKYNAFSTVQCCVWGAKLVLLDAENGSYFSTLIFPSAAICYLEEHCLSLLLRIYSENAMPTKTS